MSGTQEPPPQAVTSFSLWLSPTENVRGPWMVWELGGEGLRDPWSGHATLRQWDLTVKSRGL